MVNLNKHTTTKPTPKTNTQLCTTVVHNTAQNSCDKFPAYPSDNHQSSDDVYSRGEGPNI